MRDFMNYLIYIEYAAENLQFFLWHRDYVKRFSELPTKEQVLAPEWTAEQAEEEALASQAAATAGQKPVSREAAAVFKGTKFAHPTASTVELKSSDPFNTPPRTPTVERIDSPPPSDFEWEHLSVRRTPSQSYRKKAANAFAEADLKWQPCKLRSMPVRDTIRD